MTKTNAQLVGMGTILVLAIFEAVVSSRKGATFRFVKAIPNTNYQVKGLLKLKIAFAKLPNSRRKRVERTDDSI